MPLEDVEWICKEAASTNFLLKQCQIHISTSFEVFCVVLGRVGTKVSTELIASMVFCDG